MADDHTWLTSSPALYPFALDHWVDAVQFLRLNERDYAAAAFHDRRMAPRNLEGTWRSWRAVHAAADTLPVHCHFIFHISHVGSTLLSRLIGADPRFFALREPGVLRALAGMQRNLGGSEATWSSEEFDRRLGVFLALWSRTFTPDQCAVIKATSFVSEMAELLLRRAAGSKAVLMYVAPDVFLRALLGGAMSDITSNAEARLGRLGRRLGGGLWRLSDLSPGETVAMSWLVEMLSLYEAAGAFPDRVLWLDFDRFLNSREESLTGVLRHLGSAADAERVRALLEGPIMGRYSKAPQHVFDLQTRRGLLDEADRLHAQEIRKGMDWLEAAIARFPVVSAVVEQASAISSPPPAHRVSSGE